MSAAMNRVMKTAAVRVARSLHTTAVKRSNAPAIVTVNGVIPDAAATAPPPHSSAAPDRIDSLWTKFVHSTGTPIVPMNQLYPGLPMVSNAGSLPHTSDEAQMTVLPNGIRVTSSSASSSPLASVAVFVDAGSRYETAENAGISHFLEMMAFKTSDTRSEFRLVRDLQQISASLSSSSGREHIAYTGEALVEHLPALLAAIADNVQQSAFIPDEIAAVRSKYEEEYADKYNSTDVRMMEALHEAAYFNNTIGNPLYAPLSGVDAFTPETLQQYVNTYFTPSRIVVSAVGVDHDALVQLTQQLFNKLPADVNININAGTAAGARATPASIRARADYTGGEIRIQEKGKEPFTHVALAFETASWHDADLVPMCVLTQMMGGGGSFSAGGPGKGMYSRLYSRVLNQNEWVDSATCLNSIHSDSSLLTFYATAAPADAGKLIDVLIKEAKAMTGRVDAVELQRSKNQLKSAVLMQLENRQMRLEDIGRQVVTFQRVMGGAEVIALIEKVTAEDLQRVARKALATNPTVAAFGDLSYVPRYDYIQKAFKSLTQ